MTSETIKATIYTTNHPTDGGRTVYVGIAEKLALDRDGASITHKDGSVTFYPMTSIYKIVTHKDGGR